MINEEKDFWVQCNVCKQNLKNWVGSTPCCGSIAYLVNEDGSTSKDFILYGSVNNEPIKPLKIKVQ
jgi:hypothetical protein